jgi:Ca2+-binding RTX toxin-like protein
MVVRSGPIQSPEEVGTVSNEVIVKITPGARPEEIDAAREKFGATLLESTETLGLERWSIPEGTRGELLDEGKNDPAIEYVQPNRLFSVAQTVPNDPDFGQLWGLENTGQTGGRIDADVDGPEAWDLETGSSNVVVSVIDTGIDYTHPDLDDNMWINRGEVAGNGIDDDGNGFVDDYHGYDFVNEDGDPFDDYFHGTHVAGTIAAEGNNSLGVTGVAWDAQLMAVKVLDAGGFGTEFDIIQGIEYSALTGADISNNSYRGYGFSQGIYDAIALAGANGHLFVAAAGNETNDNDINPAYPASYNLDNIVAVAATTADDTIASFSNYGAATVDLGAPGDNIFSTLPGNGYGSLSGTSMATPHVAGTAALLLSQNPDLSVSELKSLLLDTTDPLATLAGLSVSGGRLNAANALNADLPPVELVGTEGPDVLTGTSGRDIIRGLGGDDTIQGLQGADQLFGDDGRDLVTGGTGNDTVHGGSGNDNLLAGDGLDVVFGDNGDDTILGGEGDDVLDGGDGRDRILAEAGDDTVTGGAANDMLDGGDGDDQVAGGNGNDTIHGGRGSDSLTGDAGTDTITGGTGNDTVNGDAGADRLIGVDPTSADAAGRDEIDRLSGGSQGDIFVVGDTATPYYDDGDPLTPGEADYALIADFNPTEDQIELAGAPDAYILDFFRSDTGIRNADLIYDAGVSARGERVATLENVPAGLSIADPAFVFMGGTENPSRMTAITSPLTTSLAANGSGEQIIAQQAPITLPTDLLDGAGFRWDIQGDGSIGDGTSDAYDGGLRVNEFPFFPTAETEDGGREIVIGPAQLGGVEVVRKIYVPTDQPWARFLEIVTNNGPSTANFSLNVLSNLGSDGSTFIAGTSSGDTVFDVHDQWIVTDDVDAGGDPTMLHVIGGDNALSPALASLSLDDLSFRYDLSLAPGETQIIMHFASQNPDQATALTLGPVLEEPGADALAGISDAELARIVNFVVEEPVPVIGTEGDDLLTGTDHSDIIEGRGGNDVIQGLGGNDRLSGEAGSDVIAGGNGGDTLSGGTENDVLSGDAGDDAINGDAGSDDLIGGTGNDALNGGLGNDRLLGEDGDDLIDGGDGDDTADGGAGTDTVAGGRGGDLVLGGSGDDRLAGDEGADTLQGGAGNDQIEGGAGVDRIIGANTAAETFGFGETDVLTGGSERDMFVLGDRTHVFYDDQDPLSSGEGDFALITDFRNAEDHIELSGESDLYRLDFFEPSDGVFNAALIYDTDEARGDLIAVLQNVSVNLEITDPAFLFV